MSDGFRTVDVDDSEYYPPEIGSNTPNVARAYDYVLGGKDNFAVDRETFDHIVAELPEAPVLAHENRAFLVRAVRHVVAELGVTQLLDIGAGLPTMENTHQVAQRIAPESRVVYVDHDPIVLAHGRAILAENDRSTIVQADIRDMDAILDAKETRRLLDFDQPVALLLLAIVHHLDDEDDPHALVRAYLDRLPAGSVLVLSHFYDLSDLTDEDGQRLAAKARRCEKITLTDFGSGRFRSRAEITAYFDGLRLDEYGVEYVPLWRPDGGTPVDLATLSDEQRLILGGFGRKV